MLNPIQQTSLAFEPARQQITPPVQVAPPPPVRPADLPVQTSQNSPENSGPQQDGGSKGGSQDNAFERQAQAETADKLRSAYGRLTQLKQQAAQSLVSGNARGAKEAAEEAAEVASTIRDVTGSVSMSGLGAIQSSADQLSQSSASSSDSSSSDSTSFFSNNSSSIFSSATDGGSPPLPSGSIVAPTPSGSATILDLARSGLGTAKEVVDTAAAVPQQPIEDRRAIDSYMRSVMDAMAGVEALASTAADQATAKSAAASTNGHLDIKA
jgi:hypothetical protein